MSEYKPFGAEWELEMLKFKKQDLVEMLRASLKKNQECESIPMDAEVKVNFAEFTPKQLNIIGIALENWLVEDTCISTNGKGGKPFIDKALNSKTFFERLEEASKISA